MNDQITSEARGHVGDLTEQIDAIVDAAGDVDWQRVAAAGTEIAAIALEHAPAGSAPPQLAGLSEIAAYYAITRQLADKRTRRSDFPKPLAQLAAGKVWDMREVTAFGKRHGWVQGSGPGPAKGAT